MDLQTMVKNAVAAKRSEDLNDSPQLLLGELVLKLEMVKDKDLQIHIDIDNKSPECCGSWRGSYCELAIQTSEEVSTVKEFIELLKGAIGKTFTGYKGGDYKMGKNTPVWLAEYGESGFMAEGVYVQAFFVDVKENKGNVYLVTKVGEDLY